MWLTIAIWFVGALLLALFAPSAKEYQVSSLDALPEEAQSVIAEEKVDQYFAESDGIPDLLGFEDDVNDVLQADSANILESIEEENIAGLKEILPLGDFPPDVAETFFSEDQHAALIPLTFEATLDSKEISTGLDEIYTIVEEQSDITLYVTGPAGIAVDTTDLFSRADLVLIFSTVGIILVLLIITYRSPLLALIPLVAAGFVYEVVNQILGLFGKAGLDLASQSLSIMMILLFAVVIDYSFFIFSIFHVVFNKLDDKILALIRAERDT